MSSYIAPFGAVTLTVPSGEAVAVYTQGTAAVIRNVGAPNYPSMPSVLAIVKNGQTVTSTFANGASITIDAYGGVEVFYEVGVAPVVKQTRLLSPVQVTPGVLDVTGTLTAALVLTGIVTSTTAAAVTATLATGALFETSSDWEANDSIQWTAINTGATNAFTVQGASGHTLVGSGTVAASSSATFRTVRTAASTFVTYRL